MVKRIRPKFFARFLPGLCLAVAVLPAKAQQPGPITPAPPPGREVKRIDSAPNPDAPPIPVPEIIRQFTAKEDEFSRAHIGYGFRRVIRLQEYPGDGSAGGKLELSGEIYLGPDGKRYERITNRTSTRLKTAKLEFEDLQELARIPYFPLTTDQAPRYNLTYIGYQPVDELKTYVFRVEPKHLERGLRQFEGVIYVDDRDLAIVRIYGKMVTEVEDVENELPFVMYDIQRENVDGKYWFPSYARSEDFVRTKNAENKLRLTIRMTDFKAASPAPTTAPPNSPAPKPPQP